MVSMGSRGRARSRWFAPLLVVVGVIVIIAVLLGASYNGMVTKQSAVDQSFADLDAQLQRRNDLIPNLVGAVRGALNQEQAVFGELARARQNYAGANTSSQKIAASNQIDAGLGRLLVIVESYPQLRSNGNIRDLQVQLEGTENRIAQSRRDYNAVATSYNISIRRFPRSIAAGLFGFGHKPLFKATANTATPPTVNLDTSSTSAVGR